VRRIIRAGTAAGWGETRCRHPLSPQHLGPEPHLGPWPADARPGPRGVPPGPV